jgi:dipeptidyl aminopeptidase/acylaminoacyl peptidase
MSGKRISAVLISLGALLISFSLFRVWQHAQQSGFLNPQGPRNKVIPTPSITAQNYSFQNLRSYKSYSSAFHIDSLIEANDAFSSYIISFSDEAKVVTGQLNVPTSATPSAGFPVILLVRGYVNPSIYETGIGTKNAAAAFARNGYATVAPDFQGYAGSSPQHEHAIMARLQRPVTLLNLLNSLEQSVIIDSNRLGIWAHSNGGQVTLSLLEITGKPIPATLWAPVSKSFPYSVLYYSHDDDDQGKGFRKLLASFETQFDVYDYSIDRYYQWITAPIQIHQGGSDDAVPLEWSQELADDLKEKNVPEVTLFTYPNADHNMQPDWATAIARDLTFFSQYVLEKTD